MPFFEVSCKQNINIEDAFLTLARKIREQREHRVSITWLSDYVSIILISKIALFQGENFDDGDRQKGLQDMIKNGPGSNGLGPFTLGSGGDGGRCSC